MLWTLFTNRYVILNCVWYSFFFIFMVFVCAGIWGGCLSVLFVFSSLYYYLLSRFLFAVIACGCCSFSFMPAIEMATSLYLTSSIGKQSHAL